MATLAAAGAARWRPARGEQPTNHARVRVTEALGIGDTAPVAISWRALRRVAAARTMGMPQLVSLAALTVGLALAGCASSSRSALTPSSGAAKTGAAGSPLPAVSELAAAERPTSSEFPSAAGRTLQQLARLAQAGAQLGPATATYTPGIRRLAFALTDSAERFVYAPTAVYLGTSPSAPAAGPFLAPADPLTVPRQYQSSQNEGPGGLEAIYWTELRLARPATYYVLALTRTPGRLIGATGELRVVRSSPIPDVGQRPPAIDTWTLASVHGDIGLLTTRQPPESMHSVSFKQVLGRRPVALLISTPELCTSRVCGPVTDIIVSLQPRFPQITFIHQEVYVDNQPSRGLRPQLKALHLESEPWLFAIDRRGVIVARLEGAFGVVEASRALAAALR